MAPCLSTSTAPRPHVRSQISYHVPYYLAALHVNLTGPQGKFETGKRKGQGEQEDEATAVLAVPGSCATND